MSEKKSFEDRVRDIMRKDLNYFLADDDGRAGWDGELPLAAELASLNLRLDNLMGCASKMKKQRNLETLRGCLL